MYVYMNVYIYIYKNLLFIYLYVCVHMYQNDCVEVLSFHVPPWSWGLDSGHQAWQPVSLPLSHLTDSQEDILKKDTDRNTSFIRHQDMYKTIGVVLW